MMTRIETLPPRRRATSIHGRDREVDAVFEAVRRRAARCVTVTGMAGIGKSRVIEEVRRRLGTDGRDRAVFVDGDGDLDRATLAARREVLVVASTRPLGLAREHEVPLGALGVPLVDGRINDAAIRRSPAVALLADAARLDRESLPVNELRALARVAAASDGHPVVLEQLAGWLWALSPAELLRALERGDVEAVPRDLAQRLARARSGLSSSEREILAAIAQTTGELDARAARAAVRERTRRDVPRALHVLAASGWLLRGGPPAAPRFRVPAPLRALAGGRSTGAARRRLTRHHARRAAPLLDAPVVERALVAELVNVRQELVASWEDAHARRDGDEIALAVGLAAVVTSGDPAAADLAERIGATVRRHRRARLLVAYGDALWFSGAVPRADETYARAQRTARREGDERVEAHAWIRRATLGPERSTLAAAHEYLERGARLARACGDRLLLALAAAIRGFLLRAEGEPRAALAAYEEQGEHARLAGDLFHVASSDANIADCHLALGEHALGLARYARALARMRRVDPTWARTLEGYMGLAAWESGALAEAVTRLGRALRATLTPRFRAVFAAARAGVLAELGEAARAARALAHAEGAATTVPGGADEALRAASLLVVLARADDRSRGAVERQVAAYLGERGAAAAEDDRAFVRALERAARRATPSPPPLRSAALEGRPRLARVLTALADHAGRGEVASAGALFRAAWPAEAGVPRATAEARVRKAISLLRELGFRGAIATVDGGYALKTAGS